MGACGANFPASAHNRDAGFVIVDKNRGGDVHGVHQAQSSWMPLSRRANHLGRDIERPTGRHLNRVLSDKFHQGFLPSNLSFKVNFTCECSYML